MKNKRIFASLLAGLLATSALLTGMVLPTSAAVIAEADPSTYVTVAQPVTNIIGDIAMVREINSKAEMQAVTTAATKPATALYTLSDTAQALDAEGTPFASLDEIMTAHNQTILPAFRVETAAAGAALTAYLTGKNFFDCMIVSSDPQLMKTLRTDMPTTFGVIDYTKTNYKDAEALTTEQCLDIRASMKVHNGTIALLPAHLCTKETVQYLYEHQVNVWMQISDTPTAAEQYNALLSGAVGVISDATDSLLDIACNKLPEKTLTRTPLNVGHRGIPSKAPEGTVEGSLLAYEESANVVEMDVFLTTDGRVAVMHDITTEDTCNGNLNMEESTLAQLKELYVNRGWENHPEYSQLRIPTLDEYLDAFKGKDCMLFIEIKSHKREIIAAIRKLVEDRDMYDQCAVITFNVDTMQYMREDWPEMSVGALTNDFIQGPSPAEAAVRVGMDFAGPFNGTMNPEYDVYNGAGVRAFMIRGISVYPWTFYDTIDEYKYHFLWGSAGLTGNDAHLLKRMNMAVDSVQKNDKVECGDTISTKLDVTTYNRKALRKEASSVLILEGEDLVQLNDGQMTVTGEEGQITFVLGSKDRTLGYTIYTQPITISIRSTEETTIPETEELPTEPVTTEDETDAEITTKEENTADKTTEQNPDSSDKGGCASTVSGAVLLIPALLGVALVGWKRKDE